MSETRWSIQSVPLGHEINADAVTFRRNAKLVGNALSQLTDAITLWAERRGTAAEGSPNHRTPRERSEKSEGQTVTVRGRVARIETDSDGRAQIHCEGIRDLLLNDEGYWESYRGQNKRWPTREAAEAFLAEHADAPPPLTTNQKLDRLYEAGGKAWDGKSPAVPVSEALERWHNSGGFQDSDESQCFEAVYTLAAAYAAEHPDDPAPPAGQQGASEADLPDAPGVWFRNGVAWVVEFQAGECMGGREVLASGYVQWRGFHSGQFPRGGWTRLSPPAAAPAASEGEREAMYWFIHFCGYDPPPGVPLKDVICTIGAHGKDRGKDLAVALRKIEALESRLSAAEQSAAALRERIEELVAKWRDEGKRLSKATRHSPDPMTEGQADTLLACAGELKAALENRE